MDAQFGRVGQSFHLRHDIRWCALVLGACFVATPAFGADQTTDPEAAALERDAPPSTEATDPDAEPPAELDPVIVTVRGRDEELRKVPFTVQVLSGDNLERRGATEFTEYANAIPGVTWSNLFGTDGQRVIFRGITTALHWTEENLSQTYLGVTPLSSYLSDDAFGYPPDVETIDVDRIEVLRGPQGTYFGANAVSGVIRILPREPDLYESEGFVGASTSLIYHGGTGYRVEAAGGMPLIQGRLAIRATGFLRKQDGWIDDTGTGIPDFNANDADGGRLALRYEEGALRVDALYATQHDPTVGTFDAESIGTPYQIHTDLPTGEYGFDDWDLASVSVRYDGDGLVFVSNSSFFLRHQFGRPLIGHDYLVYISTRAVDAAGDPLPSPGANSGFPPADPLIAKMDVQYRSQQWVQEFRLSSAGTRTIDWVTGFYFHHSETNYVLDTVAPGFSALNPGLTEEHLMPTDTVEYDRRPSVYDDLAVFGDLTWHINAELELGAGDRWQRHDIELQRVNQAINVPTGDEFRNSGPEYGSSPRVSLRWSPDARMTLYGIVSQGDRPGGRNSSVAQIESNPACVAELNAGDRDSVPEGYESDSFLNRELGAKTTWLDQRLLVNLAVFDFDWDRMQVPVYLGSCNLTFVDNAGEVSSRGLELELAAYPAPEYELDLNWAVIDAYFVDDVPDLSIVAGDRVANVPYFTASAGANWYFSGQSFLRFEYSAVGNRTNAYAWPGSTAPPLESYGIANLRAVHVVGAWQISAEIANLTDARANVANIDFFGMDVYRVYLPPRTLTFGFRRSF